MRLGRMLFVLALLSAGAEAAAPKRVLILHSFGRDFAPFNTFLMILFSLAESGRMVAAPVVTVPSR